ncbi:hypothetical protein KC19_4G061100 [Ceratodon purpureus]|uniref:Uncharacterized protein n=1 Tax=Ceratodon purpureus TaxID=3225 RepID=A0A8T0I658_CERPU|nr:hypothetical protein KC19_4G061100 [Ceratodon purpureus]
MQPGLGWADDLLLRLLLLPCTCLGFGVQIFRLMAAAAPLRGLSRKAVALLQAFNAATPAWSVHLSQGFIFLRVELSWRGIEIRVPGYRSYGSGASEVLSNVLATSLGLQHHTALK